ncbi:hypothetical protein VNO77_42405 [Canavalia gladiata]|uniref:DUF4220 domain-containing protein n=1 Tax=Canavalia gladiata TaxID=3824 RepID=A0AAN9JVT4_CANGL
MKIIECKHQKNNTIKEKKEARIMLLPRHRRLVQLIPDPVQEWWDKWELRGLILLSLVSQTILTLLGNRTKYKPNILTRALVWCSYLLTDWVAAVAIGVISSNVGDYYNKGMEQKNVNPQLIAFWAPFLLMHLGGPDTITAYALEDNELWLRHFVGLVAQTLLTIYIILMSWKGNWLSYVSILMFIVGFIKYGERTWSLYSGSINHLRNSFLRSIDSSFTDPVDSVQRDIELGVEDQRDFLRSILIFVSLFADFVLSPSDIAKDKYQFRVMGGFHWIYTFQRVQNDLRMMYDVFYTKAFANYGLFGLMSRLFSFTTSIVVLVLYAKLSVNNEHLVVDRIITFLLLVGALISEMYALVLVIYSGWTMYYIACRDMILIRAILEIFRTCLCLKRIKSSYSEHVQISFGQSNFFSLIGNKNWNTKGNIFLVDKLEKHVSVTHSLVSLDIQRKIFNSLYNKSDRTVLQSCFSGTPRYRNLIMEMNIPLLASEVEFHRTIVTWHIATEVFYYFDDHPDVLSEKVDSKQISDYMFYLLLKQRYMLPVGAGLVILLDTITHAMEFFEHIKVVPQQDNLPQVCRILLQHDTPTSSDGETLKVQNTSVFFQVIEIAKKLTAGDRSEMWLFLQELWVEILNYASAHCKVDMHAQQLRRSPELISYVLLLNAHFGLLEQFQIVPNRESHSDVESSSSES